MSYIEKEYDLHLERQDEAENEREQEKLQLSKKFAIYFWASRIERLEANIKREKHDIEIYKKCIERVKKWG